MTAMELVAKLTADTSGFDTAMSKAEKSGSSLKNSLSDSFGKIKKVAAGAFSVVAVKKATESLFSFANEVAVAGDRIDKQSQVLGLSRKAYQEWDYILSQNGASIDSMSTSMKTLNNVILSAADGSEEYNGALVKLGLNFVELSDMSMEDQFEAVVRAFQKMPAGANKSALAVKLFGRQGMELLPLLNQSETSIDKLRAKAEELGLIMSDDAVDASVEYGDALDDLQRTFNAFKNNIGAKILPTLTKGVTAISTYAGKMNTAFQKNGLAGVFSLLSTDFDRFITKLKESDSPVLQTLGGSLESIKNIASTIVGLFTDFDGTVAKLEGSDKPVLKLIAKALKGIKDSGQLISDLFNDFDGTVAKLQESDNPVLQVLAFALSGIKDTAETLVTLFNEGLPAAIERLAESDNPVLAELGQSIQDITEFTETAIDRINDAIDATKEFLGLSGSGGKLYATYTGKMAKSYMEDVVDEASQQAWLRELNNGLFEAGVDADDIHTIMNHFDRLNPESEDDKRYAAEALNQLTNNPYGMDQLLDTWKTLDAYYEENQVNIPVQPEASDEDKAAVKEELTEWADKNPIPIKLQMYAEGFDPNSVAPQGYLNGVPSTNGGHAKGLDYVPFDGYIAELHRGEQVLTASQARDNRSGGGSGFDVSDITSTIASAIRSSMEGVTVRSYINGRDVTQEVNRNTVKQLKARRFAT